MAPSKRFLLVLSLSVLPALAAAGPVVIDFEAFPDGTPITTQYAGLSFVDTTAITAGISLDEFEFPPHSGVNVAFDDGGPISISFTLPQANVGGYFTYTTRLLVEAFDGGGAPLPPIMSAFDSNLALTGDAGSAPNEFIAFHGVTPIALMRITGDPAGTSFTLDDLTIGSIPEPPTLSLVLFAGFGIAGMHGWGRKPKAAR